MFALHKFSRPFTIHFFCNLGSRVSHKAPLVLTCYFEVPPVNLVIYFLRLLFVLFGLFGTPYTFDYPVPHCDFFNPSISREIPA